jgi:hypothetical protein
MMSAACRRWPLSCFAETLSFTYGRLVEDVRWQIEVFFAVGD